MFLPLCFPKLLTASKEFSSNSHNLNPRLFSLTLCDCFKSIDYGTNKVQTFCLRKRVVQVTNTSDSLLLRPFEGLCIIQLKIRMSRVNQVEVFEEERILACFKEEGLVIQQNFDFAAKEHQIVIQRYNDKNMQQKPLFLDLQPEEQKDLLENRQEWTSQQENLLIELHNRKGNRWVQIARELHKNDNSVKNHYHSKLRKTLRKINKCISDYLKGQFRPLKNSVISKVVQTAEGIYNSKGTCSSSHSRVAFELKNKILAYSTLSQQQLTSQSVNSIRTLVSQIQKFTRDLKNSHQTDAPIKASNNKYKGKEIISLLSENSRKSQLKLTVSSRTFPESPNPAEPELRPSNQPRRAQEDSKNSLPFQGPTCSSSMASFPTFIYLNQGLFPFHPIYYPIYPESNLLFSGRPSSFTAYKPMEGSPSVPLRNCPCEKSHVDSINREDSEGCSFIANSFPSKLSLS